MYELSESSIFSLGIVGIKICIALVSQRASRGVLLRLHSFWSVVTQETWTLIRGKREIPTTGHGVC